MNTVSPKVKTSKQNFNYTCTIKLKNEENEWLYRLFVKVSNFTSTAQKFLIKPLYSFTIVFVKGIRAIVYVSRMMETTKVKNKKSIYLRKRQRQKKYSYKDPTGYS